jgi:uncharacterized membrane protein YidH (DUF202 family)
MAVGLTALSTLTKAEEHVLNEKASLSRQLAITLLGTGAATLGFGTLRYFNTMRALQQGKFRPNVQGVVLLTLGGAVVTGAVVRSEMKAVKVPHELHKVRLVCLPLPL